GVYGTMQQLSDLKLIDSAIRNATAMVPKSGYSFAITNPTGSGYVSGAAPALGTMGSRQFSSDESGIIYAAPQSGSTPPTTTSGTPIGN
ncbi:MAG TPA: hypothetical protein VD968_18270, partial [Pyrinomonadaceae bacterium]|nr:hypothetical protein [Pyrinomonadaceae bacterium]